MTTKLPDTCLAVDLSGDWAHFRDPTGNISRLTYRIPPRTTLCGLFASILGYARDSYYDVFDVENSHIAVVPTAEELRTMTVPQNVMGTAKESLHKVNSRGSGPRVGFPDPSDNRKQRVHEFLIEPSYRVYVSVDDEDVYEELHDYLADNRSTYTPTLGLSECLATVDFAGEYEPVPVESPESVDSPVPDDAVDLTATDAQLRVERAPLDMSRTTGSTGWPRRQTDGFVQYAFTSDDEPHPVDADLDAAQVADDTVVFL